MPKRKKPNHRINFYEFIQNNSWVRDGEGFARLNEGLKRYKNLALEWLSDMKPRLRPPFDRATISQARTRLSHWLGQQEWLKEDWVKVVLGYAVAIFRDLGMLIGRTFRALTSRAVQRTLLVFFVLALGTLAAVGTVVASATYALYASDIANPTALLNKKDTGTTILDRNGNVLYRSYGAANRKVIDLSQVSPEVKTATLAAEDPGFYHHPAFSIKAMGRAAFEDLIHHAAVQGGSTITQQLVKNALLNDSKSVTRKYQEIVLAEELERRYTKDQILQMYLNEIYYGEGAYGIQAAAQTYFHKDAKDLTLDEAALLAGLPQEPSALDPNINLEAATDRRNYVLDQMASNGFITQQQAAAAKAQPVKTFAQQAEIRAPWFVFYVLDQLKQQYGTDTVENGGLTVYTTLSLKDEQAAEQIVSSQIQKLQSHHVTDGALISMDPKTGDIMAMVGSADYNNPQWGNVNATLSDLQPGSSFKPFAYVTAFEQGWNGSTVVQDAPIKFPNGSGGWYIPHDYDMKWRGPVTLRRALSNSLNIPAIEVLQHAGIPATINTAKSMGITTLGDPSQYGLSLVLGAGDVKPIEMATAYGVFANDGQLVEPRSILKVLDKDGHDITLPDSPQPKQVLDPRYAYMITNILSDNRARTEEFGPDSALKLDRPAAAKTGTTNSFRDNWTIGYTPDVVTAVWVGNNDHSPMQNVDGVTGAGPIWHDYMETVLAGTPVHDFSVPNGVVLKTVCAKDGGLANPWDSNTYQEVFPADQVETRQCATSLPAPPQPNPQPSPTSDQAPPPPKGQTGGTTNTDNNPAGQGGAGNGGNGGGTQPSSSQPPAGSPTGSGGNNFPFGSQ